MADRAAMLLRLLCFVFPLFFLARLGLGANVTYDARSLIIDGERKLIFSASIHYPRSVPAMWPGLVAAAKEGGADAIETYVFWNGHEPSPGKYYFGGRFDLVRFVKVVQEAGLYLILRIGPFVAAEWNFGGIPVWLHYVPGTVFRTNSPPFMMHMQNFTSLIVNLMKQNKFFASQGGPIILSQIENEYGDTESVYGPGGKQYAMWAADMAVAQNTGVPWIMCQQYDAPEHVINTCNSFYCDQFSPNSPTKPKMWTENWPGWFRTFGAANPHRPPEDIAYAVARFFQKGGCLQNYYMYHGGTNFDRTAGGPFITTSYDYDAPVDEYGMVRYPKWAHLKELHETIKLCSHPLLNGQNTPISLGPMQEAHIYRTTGSCAAFLANNDDANDVVVSFQNISYHLPAWSVSILPDCSNVAFNTAKVRSQTGIVEMTPSKGPNSLKWDYFVEKAGIWGKADFSKIGFVDHINATKDSTDYLWYTTRLHVDRNEGFLKNGSRTTLLIESKGHAVHIFVNQELQGSATGSGGQSSYKFEGPITLKAGENEIALLSMTVGLQNAGPFYEWVGAGLTNVTITGFRNGSVNLSSSKWIYKIGLEGESKSIHNVDGVKNVKWISKLDAPKYQPLTWYKATISLPPGNDPVGLDMLYMGKGLAWLNGEAIGRYWPRNSSIYDGCPSTCNYRGKFSPNKCNTGCGEATQRWYHVPRSWFKPSENLLVIFEEKGGDPSKIMFSRRHVTGVCGFVSEDFPELKSSKNKTKGYLEGKASLHLMCPQGALISTVRFASFGTPGGKCGSYAIGTCHHPYSISVVEKDCLGKNKCSVSLSHPSFGMDLCPGITKSLAVEAACS